MKTLLITNYWYPWNTPGTMRWLQIGQCMSFDVLTSKQPKTGFKDYTLPPTHPQLDRGVWRWVTRFGKRLPAWLWGLLSIFHIPKFKYDTYIFTYQPESLLVSAWIMEKVFRRKVLVDMRDSIDRENQKAPWMNWIYKWFYNGMNNVIVSWQFLDEFKFAIHSGYDEVEHYKESWIHKYGMAPVSIPLRPRMDYKEYIVALACGIIPDFSNKPKGYACSSLATVKSLGYKPDIDHLHPETKSFPLRSWKQVADLMELYILGMHVDINSTNGGDISIGLEYGSVPPGM